jgi:putative FmdB family regulatory protein
MPLCDFRCSKCGYKFEKLILRPNGRTEICDHCGSTAQRLISPVGIIFKGSGFYITDSKKTSSAGSSSGKKELATV